MKGVFEKLFGGVKSIVDLFVACREFMADRVRFVKDWVVENVTVARVVLLVEVILAGVFVVMAFTSEGASQVLFVALTTLFGVGSLLVALVGLWGALRNKPKELEYEFDGFGVSSRKTAGHVDIVVSDVSQVELAVASQEPDDRIVILMGMEYAGIESGSKMTLGVLRSLASAKEKLIEVPHTPAPDLRSRVFEVAEEQWEQEEKEKKEKYQSVSYESDSSDEGAGVGPLTSPSLATAQGLATPWGPVMEGIVGVVKALGMVVTVEGFFSSLKDVQLLVTLFNTTVTALDKVMQFFKHALTIVCTRFGAGVGAWRLWSIVGGLPAIVDEVRELQEVLEVTDLAVNPTVRDRVVSMNGKLATELRKCTMDRSSHVKVVLEQLQRILAPTMALVDDLNARDTARIAPVPLLLLGPSQAAKSSYWAPLIALQAKAIADGQLGEPSQMVFRCAPDPKFPYNSYKGQSIVISDDHFASKEDDAMLESLYRLFELTGAQKQPIASAEAEMKGRLFLSHEMVIFTENSPDFSRIAKVWANIDSVTTRMANNFEMVYPVLKEGKLVAGEIPRLRGKTRSEVEKICVNMKFHRLSWATGTDKKVHLVGQVIIGQELKMELLSHDDLAREMAKQLQQAKINFAQSRAMLQDSILEVIGPDKEKDLWEQCGLEKVDARKVTMGLNPLELAVYNEEDLPRIKCFLKQTNASTRKSALVKLLRMMNAAKTPVEKVDASRWEEIKSYVARIAGEVVGFARSLAWIALGAVVGSLVGLAAFKIYFALSGGQQSFDPRIRTTKKVPWMAPGGVVSATAQIGEPKSNVFAQRSASFANISAYSYGDKGVEEISRGSGFMVTDRVLMTAGHVLQPLGPRSKLAMKVGGTIVCTAYAECVVLSGDAIPVAPEVPLGLQLPTDIAFVKLPVSVPNVRDSRGLFLAGAYYQRLLGERLQRMSRDGPDDPINLTTGRAVDVKSIKFTNTTATLPYAFMYEAPGMPGESGAPIQHVGPSSFSGFIAGVHAGLSPGGLSVMVPFCRESLTRVLDAMKDFEAPKIVRGLDFVGETVLVEKQSVVPLPSSSGDVVEREKVVVTAPMIHDIVESPIARLLPEEKRCDKKLSRLHCVVEVEEKKIHTFQRVLDSFARPHRLVWNTEPVVEEFVKKYVEQVSNFPSRYELSTEEALLANELGPGFERGQSAGRFGLPASRTKEYIMTEDKKPTKALIEGLQTLEAYVEGGGIFRDMVTALAKSEPLESEKVVGDVPRTRAFYPDSAVVQVLEKKWFAPIVAAMKRNSDKLGTMLGSTPTQRDALAKWLDAVVRFHKARGQDQAQIVGFDKVANDMYLEMQCHRVVHDVLLGIAEKLFRWHRVPEAWMMKRLMGMSCLLKSSASKYVAMPTLLESGSVGYAAYACTINASGRWLTSPVNDIWNRFSHWRIYGAGLSWDDYMAMTMYYTYSDDGIGVCLDDPEYMVEAFNTCTFGPRTKQDGGYFMGSEVFFNRAHGHVFALKEESVSQTLCFVSRRLPLKEAMEANVRSALIELAARGEMVWKSWCDDIRAACRSANLDVTFPTFEECERIRFE